MDAEYSLSLSLSPPLSLSMPRNSVPGKNLSFAPTGVFLLCPPMEDG